MAWTERRDKTWRGGYRDSSGRRRYGSRDPNTGKPFSTERAALRWASAMEDEARRGSALDPQGPRMRWGEWRATWYPTRATEASTERGMEPKLRLHVAPRWDDVKLGDVARLDVQRWVNELGRTGMAAASVRQCYYLLRSSLQAAVSHGLLAANPCQGVKLPTLPQGQERYLTDAELDAVFYRLDGVHYVTAHLLLGTGLRLAEVAGLHWSRLDLSRQRVDVVDVWDGPEGVMKAYPKGRKRRTVPITDELADLLARWHDRNPAGVSCGRTHGTGGGCRSSLVVSGARGAPLNGHNYTERVWKPATELAGIGAARVHDLRHTYASRLVTAGVSIQRVSRLLGHASVQTTERYAHLMDEGHEEVRAALSPGRGDEGTGQGTTARVRAVSPTDSLTG